VRQRILERHTDAPTLVPVEKRKEARHQPFCKAVDGQVIRRGERTLVAVKHPAR